MHRERRVCRRASVRTSAYDFRIDDRKSMILLSDRRACTLSILARLNDWNIYESQARCESHGQERRCRGFYIVRLISRRANLLVSFFLCVRVHTRVFPFSTLPDRIVPFVRRRVAQPLFRRSPLDLQFRPRNPRYSTLLFLLSRLHHFPRISRA